MVKLGFPLTPLILGVVQPGAEGLVHRQVTEAPRDADHSPRRRLDDQLETSYIRAVMTDGNHSLFVTRPQSGVLLALSVVSVAVALWQRRRPPAAEGEPKM